MMKKLKIIVIKYWGYFIILFIYAGISCNSPTEVQNPVFQPIDPTLLDSLDFQQTYYDSVLIKSKSTILLDSKEIDKIVIGIFDNDVFTPQDTVNEFYETVNGKLHLLLNYKMALPDTQLAVNIGVKFLLANGSDYVVRKNINLFQYPYPETKILLRWKQFVLQSIFLPDIQDFAFRPPHIYYHPFGPNGLYDYNINTKETRLLFDYAGGDNLDANGSFIFIDYGHKRLYRYNILKDTVDKTFDLYGIYGIMGIASSDSIVYVSTLNPNKLFTFSADLTPLKSIDFYVFGTAMAYYNNDLFVSISYASGGALISQVNAESGSLIKDKAAPDRNISGIYIYNGILYFSDYTRKYVGYIPLKDIFPELK